jgi:hypothetical protein
MRRLSEVDAPPPLAARASEAIKQFFDKGPPSRHKDTLTDLLPMLRTKSKTSSDQE